MPGQPLISLPAPGGIPSFVPAPGGIPTFVPAPGGIPTFVPAPGHILTGALRLGDLLIPAPIAGVLGDSVRRGEGTVLRRG
ncbi:hypothetical protein [Actinoplanes utahensis]|uniref:Uncharacterized protein n=1 Tax=Actinoplanes utahensis TaxID=1869 RepID=A0A0A6UMM4_ACTUT|nr:hypothetical protein [Actinoplanes utahensis]KHD77370.1 hypothetical protein MB27_11465 [Actinoplanes utahensis]GIF32883.1 hypothetical protein Aut01nite_58690 [Actinoplanes utahensis]